jgi:hypothetical protein
MVRNVGINYGREEFGCGLRFKKLVFGKVILLLFLCPAAPAALSGSEVLSRLQAFDAAFQAGFTASAIQPGVAKEAFNTDKAIPAVDKEWQIVMANGRYALVVKSVDVPPSAYQPAAYAPDDVDPVPGRITVENEDRTFWGPDYVAKYEFGRSYSLEGDQVKVSTELAVVSFYPPDYAAGNRPLKRFLWSTGRGFAKFVYELTSAVELEDGTIKCLGPGTDSGASQGRWELVVDPAAGYLVRSAKYYEPDALEADTPAFVITNSGTLSMNGCIVAESSMWLELEREPHPVPFGIKFVTREPDYELLKAVENGMFGPYEYSTSVVDARMEPPIARDFEAGEVYSTVDRFDFDPLGDLEDDESAAQPVAGKDKNVEAAEVKSEDTNAKAQSTTERVTDTGNSNPVTGTSLSSGQIAAISVLCVAVLAAVLYWKFYISARRT